MNAEQLCWWLQGYIDLTEAEGETLSMTSDQVGRIKSKLSLALNLPVETETGVKRDCPPAQFVPALMPLRGHWMETVGPVTPDGCIPDELNINQVAMDDSDLDPAYQRFISSPPKVVSDPKHMVSG